MAQIQALLSEADLKIEEAVKLADTEGLAFTYGLGNTYDTYISKKFLTDLDEKEEQAKVNDEDFDRYEYLWEDMDLRLPEFGGEYPGWQNSNC